MASKPTGCSNEECKVAVDGKCVEGLPLDECPHATRLSVEDIEDIEEVEEKAVSATQPAVLNLSLGDALDREDASALQCRRVSRTIGIIGPNDAGKTSLVAGVYDLLQGGPVAGVGFAGSSTLIGFEKICHDARAASRRDAPHTERTSAGAEATFFHLDLRPSEGEVVSLFIGDRSGEDYLAAADDLARAGDLFEIRRADVVTLLVNGEHLVSSEHRHEAKAATPQIVDALVEARSLRPGCHLAIVLTKKDSVLASAHVDRAHRDFDELVESVRLKHGGYLGEIGSFIIAASPKESTQVKRGEGVDRLLLYWLEAVPAPSAVPRRKSESGRMIDLLDANEETAG
ncbi:TRAFAC clade GTPase domain-containing protein [Sinirhodobacter huangdaonensis]|uniref:Double-GTPase 2 domain-containing protein n=1 Tax=Paenirhodobacter huangdaonensis TaxID=2501515 RepID=A0A3S3MBD6_9RHOB|nr:hypothetical protein [Sinirhodobacter huangdaonensis]RWR54066.1 hypothetical protein EOW66_05515 [Sinirhodobacter huangdaonensis]